mgnify:CR=1 FL=1
MPMPARYNELNTTVRVLNISGKATEKRIAKALRDREIAKQLVGKWFNRDYQGRMNMERIHEWGGYNATYSDLKRAESTVRGTAMLSDEGEELLKNTFVMVCDISYYDRKNTGMLLAASMQSLGVLAGNFTNNQSLKQTYERTGNALANASLDIAGFSVNIISYLYRLEWNDELLDKIYSNYWIDDSTPAAEVSTRQTAFNNDKQSFKLEFLGQYRSRAGKTVSRSSTVDMNMVIREVCASAVNNSINNLAKMFPVFKAKTPFYCDNGEIYAYIGTKEGMTMKSKYEVIETQRTKDDGIKYKRVSEVRPSNVWNNRDIYIMDDSIGQRYKGSKFQYKSGRRDICNQGLMLREMGRLGYQYKRHNLYVGLHLGSGGVDESKFEDQKPSYYSRQSIRSSKSFAGGFDLGWVWNVHSNVAWAPLSMSLLGGGDLLCIGGTTGVIFRTNPLGKKGRWSFFVWPSVGYSYVSATATADYYSTRYRRYRRSYIPYTVTNTMKVSYNEGGFDWGIKAGVNITERLFVCAEKTQYFMGGTFGYLF